MFRRILVLFFTFIFLSKVYALSECEPHTFDIEPVKNTVYWCDDSNQLIRADKLFSNGNISTQVQYKDGKIVNRKVFNIDQEQTFEGDIEELDDGSYITTKYSLAPFRSYILEKTHKLNIEGKPLAQTLARWVYEVNGNNSQLKMYIIYKDNSNIIQWKGFYNKEGSEIIKWAQFFYDNPNETQSHNVKLIHFNILDGNKKLISTYKSSGPYTLEDLYGDSIPEYKPLGIVVVDSGYETDHQLLTPYWYINPLESFDGIDNDNNGMIDDVYGYQVSGKGEESSNIREVFSTPSAENDVVSHGTHVAALAAHGLKNWSLAAFAGDYTRQDYLERIGNFIQDHQARFVNMSFAFGKPGGPMSPPMEAFTALENFIAEAPNVLFFAAAGNDGLDIDQHISYPASYSYENLIVIGALKASQWQDVPNIEYSQVADFSSIGNKSVDIFAPGEDVVSALVGYQEGPLSGTSMATPKALNVAARASGIYPDITLSDLKKIFLLSAYIPDLNNPLPCTSGGLVYEQRFMESLKNFTKGYSHKDSVLLARKTLPVLEGESLEGGYLKELNLFWSKQNLL